jgi:hypothetical protein
MKDPISNKAIRAYLSAMYPGQTVRVVCTRSGETHVKGKMPRHDGGCVTGASWSPIPSHPQGRDRHEAARGQPD